MRNKKERAMGGMAMGRRDGPEMEKRDGKGREEGIITGKAYKESGGVRVCVN